MTEEVDDGERRRDPGPTGSQYEKDRRESRIRAALLGAFMILTLILAVLAVANTLVSADRSKEKDFSIRESQFRVCVNTANALREDVRDEFVQLKERVLIPVFSSFLALAPPEQQDEPGAIILKDSVDLMVHRAKTIDNRIPDLNCLAEYPPLEGQTYPADLLEQK